MKYLAAISVFLFSVLFAAGVTGARAAEKEYSVDTSLGLGYDSNAFLSPDKSYFDPNEGRIVEPDRKSGFFFPLSFDGKLSFGAGPLGILSSVGFDGRFYPEKELTDADTYRTEVSAGPEFLLRQKGGRRDTLFIGPSATFSRQVYYDRDTGDERVTSITGRSLGERFNYLRLGLGSVLRIRTLPVRIDLKGEVSKYDYEEVPVLDSLDHTYSLIAGDIGFDIFRDAFIRVSADYFIRDYEDRRSRDLDGDLSDGTLREYSYYGTGVLLGARVVELLTVSAGYDYFRRTDGFAGYNDYSRDRFRVRARCLDGKGRKISAGVTYWTRDYPRAFAFDDPDFQHKSYKTWEGGAGGEFPLSRAWRFWSQYEYIRQQASDPRYDYRRHLLTAGIGAEL